MNKNTKPETKTVKGMTGTYCTGLRYNKSYITIYRFETIEGLRFVGYINNRKFTDFYNNTQIIFALGRYSINSGK